jgi:hypothetical protein
MDRAQLTYSITTFRRVDDFLSFRSHVLEVERTRRQLAILATSLRSEFRFDPVPIGRHMTVVSLIK